VLEAMACGTPVITSNCASLPEVAGDAAVLVDPGDVAQIVGALAKLTSEQHLRQELAEMGLQRSKQFSWEKTSQETLQIMGSMMR
jgi:glycosyltransferase involved in cell wall biosynthesis